MASEPIIVSDHEVLLDGHRLFAKQWRPARLDEQRPVIILLHDSLGCVELWRDFPEQLAYATGLTVVAYDRLGFGRSDPSPDRLDRNFMAREAATGFRAVREQFGIERFVSFGHSAGGGIAIASAAAFPQSCAAVITEAAQAFAEDKTLEGIRTAERTFSNPDQMARLARYHEKKAAWVLEAWVGTWLSSEFADWTLDALLMQARCPILAFHGDHDEYGSAAHPDRIVAKAAGAAAKIVLEHCGHVPHRQHPERVLASVANFLVGLAPPDRPLQ